MNKKAECIGPFDYAQGRHRAWLKSLNLLLSEEHYT